MARFLTYRSRFWEPLLLSNYSQTSQRCGGKERRLSISMRLYYFPSIFTPVNNRIKSGICYEKKGPAASRLYSGLYSPNEAQRSNSHSLFGVRVVVEGACKKCVFHRSQSRITTHILKFSMSPTLVSGTLEASNNVNMDTSGSEPVETKKIKMDTNEIGKENRESTQAPVLRFVKMTEFAHAPTRGSSFAAGYDLKSAYKATVPARGSCLVKTDIQIQLPSGTYGRVAPRSGLALKNKIDVGAGVIDEDYRGNVGVILFNHSDVDFEIAAGDRIAQLICEKIVHPEAVEVKSLDVSVRGENGFGSTGSN